ncbi:MAG: hypothetical protein PHR39_06030 [Actinomycetota bacterium]|nr:hypothetical protein [Actinomycetota bacterium]
MFLSIIKLILALSSLFFIGYPFSYLLLIKSRNAASESEAYHRYRIIYGRTLMAIISFYLGALIAAIYLIVVSLLGINYDLIQIVVFSLLFFVYSLVLMIRHRRNLSSVSGFLDSNIENVNFLGRIGRKKKDKQNYEQLTLHKSVIDSRISSFKKNIKNSKKTGRIINPILIIMIIANILIVLFFALLFPIRFWDAISCWSLKAKAFFIDKNMLDFFVKHDYYFSAMSYPPFLSLIQTWIYLWTGSINENLVKVIFPIFYSSGIFLVFNFFKKKFNETISLILAFIFATIPMIVDHGYIEYSNMLFSIILLIAVYFFSSFISNEVAEINKCVDKKKNIIEKVKMYIFEHQHSMVLELKIYDSVESVFKNKYPDDFGLGEKFGKNSYENNIRSENVRSAMNRYDSEKGTKVGLLKIDRLRKYSHLYLSAIFFGILALTRSEGIFYCVLFLVINLSVYFYGLTQKIILKNKFKKVLISIAEPLRDDEIKEWQNSISGKFIRNGDPPLVHLKLFFKKIFYPVLILFVIYLPWLIFKLKLSLPFMSDEWRKALSLPVNAEFISEGFKRAASGFLMEFIYSPFDSTKAFFGSFYGPVLMILAMLFFIAIKKIFTNGGLVFFLFVIMVLLTSFISIIFVPDFEGSLERYILPAFPLAYYWILSNTFKIKPKNGIIKA